MGRYDADLEQDRKQIEERERKFHKYYAYYKNRIEQYLQEEKYNEIEALFEQKNILELAQIDTGFAVINIIVNIYRMEKKEQSVYKIWGHIHSMDELLCIYQKLKMYMWRLEFTEDQNSFIHYVMEQEISVPCIKWLVHTSAFHKADTVYKIAVLCKENKHYKAAFELFSYLKELL